MPDHARSGRTALRAIAALLALLALLPATATAAAPRPALPAAASAGCPGADVSSSTWLRGVAVRCLVNRARSLAGLPRFRGNRSLGRAATRHARDMARGHYFGHRRSGGPPLQRRARRAGWRGSRLGEAIAYGCYDAASPLSIVSSWLASPPHAAVLLSRGLERVGIGSARAPMECPGATYVLVAGRG